ncbi:hypothetical protein Rhe02_58690 [Rhizocola hellebori]|uniref:Uncharacterized protein n=1 Tax=Rhizocola hellebori TaxID=1392758 RepID=A0A8J3QD35_9ACTN|nr:hypothetical protein [Rhizocola hellebori]GIH07802.1 hypothetical protein Rhe02_58690 [Rhizocola hellebori]
MANQPEETVGVLRAMWAASGQRADADEACGPQKSCKNMKDVTFDGLAEPGSDLGAAWREKLRREGKLGTSAPSIRELVLGPAETQ